MKLTRYFFAVMLFSITATLSNVQAQSTKKMLMRTWVMSFDEMIKKMPAEQRKMIEMMTDEQKDRVKNQISQSYFDFKADGTFEAFMNGKKESMTWNLSADGKELITTEESGKVTRLIIVELSKTRLVLEGKEDKEKVPPIVFIPKK